MADRKRSFHSEYLKTMAQLVTAAFALIAALAWNEAIKGLINKFIAPGSTLLSQVIYALIVTTIAVIITFYLGRLTQEAKEEESAKRGSAASGKKESIDSDEQTN